MGKLRFWENGSKIEKTFPPKWFAPLPQTEQRLKQTERNADFHGTKRLFQGSVPRTILRLALPMTLAQLINVLYNIVDRIYIGHLPEASTLALTGLGLTFPIITIISAFSNLFGMGGAPSAPSREGRGDLKRAEDIMGNSFAMLFGFRGSADDILPSI